jgi:3-(3-hydroxy-phenyl)propionate hydroxylase
MAEVMPDATDVLVVGCGPVGAVLAIMLGMRGVRTVVIDKATEIFPLPRAIAFDSDAQRILQSIGLMDEEFRRVEIPHVRMISPIFGEFGRINTSKVEDTHPIQITFYQPEFEAALRRKMAAMPEFLTIALGVELVGFSETPVGVKAELREGTTTRKISARYIVGADGANSLVRNLIGQAFDGKSYSQDWLIVDALPHAPTIKHIEFSCDPRRPSPHMPAPGGRERWEFMLAKGETRQQMESDEAIDKLLKPWGGLAAVTVERRAVYRFHARCARSFQKGRAFLAGDAAHITPPFVGQGLVSGLRDAANLSWKLAMVVKDEASPDILDSYTVERLPHAKAMINMARQMGQLIMPQNLPTAFVVHGFMRLIRLVPRLRSYLEDLGIKPANQLSAGLFSKEGGRKFPRPGSMIPQAWLTDCEGRRYRSDDVLGGKFAVLGFGVKPEDHLDESAKAELWRMGATCLRIDPPESAAGQTSNCFRDLDGVLMERAQLGTISVVRPDKVVMCSGAVSWAGKVIARASAMLARG